MLRSSSIVQVGWWIKHNTDQIGTVFILASTIGTGKVCTSLKDILTPVKLSMVNSLPKTILNPPCVCLLQLPTFGKGLFITL